MIGSQGLRFFNLLIKFLFFRSLKSIIFDSLKNNSSRLAQVDIDTPIGTVIWSIDTR